MTGSLGDMIHSPLLIVSNRQPYRHEYESSTDEIVVDRPEGGVVAGLDAVAQEVGGTWIAWGDGDADEEVSDDEDRIEVPPDDESYTLRRIWLDEDEVEGYYEGYANRVLWPLCHTATGAMTYTPESWDQYKRVNEKFAATVRDALSSDAVVWFQDYHLALAPANVRPVHDGMLAHFWHIPWPAVDVFRMCPQRRELLEGLLANDLIGFHVEQYCRQFLDCVETLLPAAIVDREAGTITFEDRTIRVDAFPLGVDVDEVRSLAGEAPAGGREIRETYNVEGQLVLGVDRLDYSKGIPERLTALEHLWANRPALRGTFTYIQKEMPSREAIPEYRALQDTSDERVTEINGRFATDSWTPIVRIDEYLPDRELYGLYRAADVMLVSSLRDGMNLVAQEYVASQIERDGVLVLSELTGCHEFLGEDALSVNPYDVEGHATAIGRAVSMNAVERNRRMRALNRSVEALDIDGWIDTVLEEATTATEPAARRVGE